MNEQPVVVVLGAGMGGRGVVKALAGKAHLVVIDRTIELAQTAADLGQTGGGSADALVVDLTDLVAVEALASDLTKSHGRVDAVIHLVGGWRGSQTVDAESIDQWNELIPGIVTTVQTTSVAFRELLMAAPMGRYVMVTSTAAAKPTKGNAAYASAKAAAETWVKALGSAFTETPARACIVAVLALADQATRDANPDRNYDRYTDTDALGVAIAGVLADEAVTNGEYIDLTASDR
ncbi:MAG: SDR family oxidoreductase [Actinobacteria bacterium]|nr:SDR family oxidoreductase [Actinomycetota bacterium]